ncbi:MAG: response regulator [bacterium]
MDFSDKTILVVDDDKDFCFLIRMMFKKTRAKLVFAYDGKEAIRIIRNSFPSEPVSVVLLDIQMPRISGYTVIETLKELQPDLPVLALTAFGMTGEREKCLKLGFDEYLAKPFEEQDLFTIIRRLTNKRL